MCLCLSKPAALSRGTGLKGLPAPPNAEFDRPSCWMEGTGCPDHLSLSQQLLFLMLPDERQALHYLAALPGVSLGHLITTSYNLQLPLFFLMLLSLLLSGHILEENYYPLNRI